MTKTKRIALILASCVLLVAAVLGVSFAVWSNLEKEQVFTLKAGTLELNISSSDVMNSEQKISFDNPVEMSFKVKVEGEKSTLTFIVDNFQYSLVEGEYLPLSKELFNVEVSKRAYGIGGDAPTDTATCEVRVSLTDAYDYDSFDPVLMGKKFRFNIRVKAETYQTPTEYGITYHNVDGAVNTNITKWSVETNHTFLAASKDGFNFLGWYTDASLDDKFKIAELVQDDLNIAALNIYAKWEAIKYNITCNFGSGIPVDLPNQYDITQTIDLTETQYIPTNTNPTLLFGGYYEDATFNTRIDKIEGRTGNITLFAKWVQQYNITYTDALNAPNDNPKVFSALDSAITLRDLTKDGYTFLGWFNGQDTKVETIDTTTENDIQLTAKWEANTYAITWDYANGDPITDIITEYTYGANTDISGYVPTRKGYTFAGWYLGGSPIEAIPVDTIDDITITAKWEIINNTINWNVNDGTLAEDTPTTYTIDDSVNPADFVPTKVGHTFKGWYTNSGLTDLATTIPTGETGEREFYAKWEANTYAITWNYANGDPITDIITTYTYGAETDISGYVPTRKGYTFAGWYLGGSPIEAIPVDTIDDITITAHWTIVQNAIIWHKNGGELAPSTPTTYTILDTVNPANFVPTKEGHTFAGWYTNSGLTDLATTIPTGETGEREFYAKWDIVTYNINVEPNGGALVEGQDIPTSYDINTETIALPTPTKADYDFLGWYTTPDFSESAITEIAKGSTGDISLHAKWQATVYQITYNAGFGTIAEGMPTTYTVEDTIDLTLFEPTPISTDYVFEGYYLDAAFTEQVTTITPGSMSGDKTIYLNWTSTIV